MKNLSFLLLAGLLTMTACQSNGKKKPSAEELMEKASKNPGANAGSSKFEISAPAGWEKKDTLMNGIQITYMLSPMAEGNFRANINIVTQSMGDKTPDSYFDLNLSQMGKYLQNYSAGKNGEKQINGLPAKWMTYSHTMTGNDIEVLAYIVPKDGIAYIISCSAPKGTLNKYQASFDESVGSFKVQ